MLLIDKYNITDKDDIIFHFPIYEKLLSQKIDRFLPNKKNNNPYNYVNLPNLLIYGPPGSGKKTLINILLKDIYGEDIERINKETYSINGYGNTSIDIEIEQSNYHLIIEPNNSGFDKYMIQEIVNEYAKRKILQVTNQKIPFKIVFINNVDNLSYYAQTSLRCTMERYHKTCKFILCGYQLSKIIDPLRSRCLNVRIPHPTKIERLELILDICNNENLELSIKDCKKIINKCEGNIKVAIWMLELMKYKIKDLDLSWKKYLTPIVDMIYNYGVVKKHKILQISQFQELRQILNTILITNITGTEIMVELLEKIVKYTPSYHDDLLSNMIEKIAFYEIRLSKGKRSVIHLESLIIDLIYLANSYKWSK